MANTKSAEKRDRQNQRRRDRNRALRSRLRTAVKKVRRALDGGKVEDAQALLPEALKILDGSVGKGIAHRNAAARSKSRLVRAVRAAVPKKPAKKTSPAS